MNFLVGRGWRGYFLVVVILRLAWSYIFEEIKTSTFKRWVKSKDGCLYQILVCAFVKSIAGLKVDRRKNHYKLLTASSGDGE